MDYPIQTPGQLASQLRALRKARGLSQALLGKALDVGQTRIARIERDPTAISVEQFLRLLNALGVKMVLRSPEASTAPGPAREASRARATGSLAGKRRILDEPW